MPLLTELFANKYTSLNHLQVDILRYFIPNCLKPISVKLCAQTSNNIQRELIRMQVGWLCLVQKHNISTETSLKRARSL